MDTGGLSPPARTSPSLSILVALSFLSERESGAQRRSGAGIEASERGWAQASRSEVGQAPPSMRYALEEEHGTARRGRCGRQDHLLKADTHGDQSRRISELCRREDGGRGRSLLSVRRNCPVGLTVVGRALVRSSLPQARCTPEQDWVDEKMCLDFTKAEHWNTDSDSSVARDIATRVSPT